MEKLFLTQFVFNTGGTEYSQQRIVVAPDSDTALEKAKGWFAEDFPESELLSVMAHPAIT